MKQQDPKEKLSMSKELFEYAFMCGVLEAHKSTKDLSNDLARLNAIAHLVTNVKAYANKYMEKLNSIE